MRDAAPHPGLLLLLYPTVQTEAISESRGLRSQTGSSGEPHRAAQYTRSAGLMGELSRPMFGFSARPRRGRRT